jgi:hypothetical protein
MQKTWSFLGSAGSLRLLLVNVQRSKSALRMLSRWISAQIGVVAVGRAREVRTLTGGGNGLFSDAPPHR